MRLYSVPTSSSVPDIEQLPQKNLLIGFQALEFYTFYIASHINTLLATSLLIIFTSLAPYICCNLYNKYIISISTRLCMTLNRIDSKLLGLDLEITLYKQSQNEIGSYNTKINEMRQCLPYKFISNLLYTHVFHSMAASPSTDRVQ